jgi:hypothetical protein
MLANWEKKCIFATVSTLAVHAHGGQKQPLLISVGK